VTLYLLDTTTIIDLSKGNPVTDRRMREAFARGDHPGVCSIVVCEFETGLLAADRPGWEQILRRLWFWPTSLQAAQRAGQERFAFAHRGVQIAVTDALIAAVAREVGAVLVTDNVKDFPQPDLQVVSWRT